MIKYLKIIYKLLIFSLTFAKPKNILPNTLLIIKIDGFGDYVLFRNFLYEINNNSKYKMYKITLVANIAWKEFALIYDSNIIDSFIWVDRKLFHSNLFYRTKIIRQICKIGYEVALYPTFLRETLGGDSIMKALSAKNKVASIGDVGYRHSLEELFTNRYYTQLINFNGASEDHVFEFDRNREIFANFLDKDLSMTKLSLVIPDNDPKILNYKYIVFFVGASDNKRKWPNINMIKLAENLYNTYQFRVVLSGAHDDVELYQDLNVSYIDNLIGKTSQLELVKLLAHAEFVVSNETSVPHLCVALNILVFVIYAGGNFIRFTPYPNHITDKYVGINHPFINNNLNLYQKISNTLAFKPYLNIGEITVDQVYEAITAKCIIPNGNH